MVATNLIASSSFLREAFKTANLLKSLNVNAFIYGSVGTGKKTIASYIAPNALVVDAQNTQRLLDSIAFNDVVIVLNLNKIQNYKLFYDELKKNKTRVIACYSSDVIHHDLLDLFSLKLYLPPLVSRVEDVSSFINHFEIESKSLFNISTNVVFDDFEPDLSENLVSLKKQIYSKVLTSNIDESTLMKLIENHLFHKIGGKNDYRDFLHIFEVPLIKAGIKKFKSQLKLSAILGLNRNTLRKKISENSDYLETPTPK